MYNALSSPHYYIGFYYLYRNIMVKNISTSVSALLLLAGLSLSAILLGSCSEDNGLVYTDWARLQFYADGDITDLSYSFVWGSATRQRDTVYLPVRVLGGPADYDRTADLEQVFDSAATEDVQAKPSVHYVPFNDEGARKLLTVRAGRVIDSIGVIVLRDASLAKAAVRLRLRIKENNEFGVGETKKLERSIVISDLLEKPSTWDRTTDYYLGTYSTAKHQLMLKVVGGKVDDEWITKVNASTSLMVYWRGKFEEALENFNNDPANIASGLAPLREDASNPNSKLVTFPTKL